MTNRSNRYTHGHSAGVLESHTARTIANSAAYLLPHLAGGQRLLDVGCGPGTITAEFAQHVAEVVGIDRSEDVVAIARERAGEAPVTYATGDVHALEFADDSFDVVHAHQVLQHLADPVHALQEMRRVCKPGGLVAVRDADYEAMTWYPAALPITRWLETYRAVARSNDAEPDAGRHLLAWGRAAGFSRVECSVSAWCFATPDERAWWGDLWADRCTEALAEQFGEHGVSAADRDDMVAAWRTWAAEPDGWFSVLHGEALLWK
ncbi:MAG: methyltransferase domain-containing protein [Acidimicrobiales bacterium]|nr:methyltransferase domain-containing protein [Acidimicrobiales bacterium]